MLILEITAIIVSVISCITNIFGLFKIKEKNGPDIEEIINNLIEKESKITNVSTKIIVDIVDNSMTNVLDTVMKIFTYKFAMKFIIEELIKIYDKKNDDCEIKKQTRNIIISTSYYEEEAIKLNKACFAWDGIIVIGAIIDFYTQKDFPIIIFGLIFLAITLSYKYLLRYRISRGFFGTNFQEAKILLEYIEKNKDKFDKGNKIFNDEQDVYIPIEQLIRTLGKTTEDAL